MYGRANLALWKAYVLYTAEEKKHIVMKKEGTFPIHQV
jgi:hypothetical protein